MTAELEPHQATYTLLDASGRKAGSEDLRFARVVDGWRLTSGLATWFPTSLTSTVDWQLDRDLRTRVLRIGCTTEGNTLELELAVTGNGLLAHRVASDGPSQVEMGWGPNAELDYLSAAFPTVMVARSRLSAGAHRAVEVLHIATEDLLPTPLSLGLKAVDQASLDLVIPATGHRARLRFGEWGALLSYEGVLTLDALIPLK